MLNALVDDVRSCDVLRLVIDTLNPLERVATREGRYPQVLPALLNVLQSTGFTMLMARETTQLVGQSLNLGGARCQLDAGFVQCQLGRPGHIASPTNRKNVTQGRQWPQERCYQGKRRSYSESTWNPSQSRSDAAAGCGITDRLRRLCDEFFVGFDTLPPVQTAMLPATLLHLMKMGFVSAKIDRSAVARWIEELGTEPRRLSRAELRRTEGICQVSCT